VTPLTYVLEAAALVVLQKAVLATEVTVAEAAVTKDALDGLAAVLGTAADLLGDHCDFYRAGERVWGCTVSRLKGRSRPGAESR
jgi:hypothetical protein